MKTRQPDSKLQHRGRVGDDDLDFVFLDEAKKTYYVPEAKGLEGRRRTRNLGTAKDPIHAQQGSVEYLKGTIDVMIESNDPVRRDIALKLKDALDGKDGFKLIYMEVATKKKVGGLGFTITHFIE